MKLIQPNVRQRGMMAVIAMMYVMLFSMLAVGFYATVNTASQASHNDVEIARAQLAAESGVEFLRYQLDRVTIPPGATGSGVTGALYNDLVAQMNGTANLSGLSLARNDAVISVPASGYIKLDTTGRSKFLASITDWPQQGKVVVKVTGTSGKISRSIQMDFTRVPRRSSVFDFAVASKGQIVLEKGSVSTVDPQHALLATAMSALENSAAVKVNGGNIGGEITVLDSAGVSVTKGSVAGSSIPSVILNDHVNTVPEPPEFPTVDPTVYRNYATDNYVAGKKTQKNIYIPPNTNPSFNGGDSVQGILYIASPNTVTFRGNFTLQGFLVMATSTQGQNSTDKLDFRGNVSQQPLPSGAQFDSLRAASGVSMLAPTANVTMSGSTDSLMRGNVIVNTFNFQGSADIVVDNGTLMTLKESANSAVFSGKTVKFTATGANNLPQQGVSFSRNYSPEPASYEELLP